VGATDAPVPTEEYGGKVLADRRRSDISVHLLMIDQDGHLA
jgi:hypothetical protein